jgi:hypothetical protein
LRRVSSIEDGQRDGERRAVTGARAVYRDDPAVQFDELAREREADAEPAGAGSARPAALGEESKNSLELIRRDSFAGVSAERMPLSPTLPACNGALQDRSAGARADRAGTLVRLPFERRAMTRITCIPP